MTRGARQLCTRLGAAGVSVVLALAGCGGSGGQKASSTKSSTTHTSRTTATTGAAPKNPVPVARVLSETIRSQLGTTYAAKATATAGQTVLLRTIIPASTHRRSTTVQLTVHTGPDKSLTITAAAGGHRSTAMITSSNGHSLTLLGLHYTCTLPPFPSFCPVQHPSLSGHTYRMQFSAEHQTPIYLVALVGPVKTPVAATKTASSSVVPPYTASQLVESVSPLPTGAAKGTLPKRIGPLRTVTAKPGDTVAMITQLTATGPVGAPQPVTITIDQGPSRSLIVSAKVPGGSPSIATVKSTGSTPIDLVVPHYVCSLSPTPTFCPATKVVATGHRYEITFLASPITPPVVLLAKAQSG